MQDHYILSFRVESLEELGTLDWAKGLRKTFSSEITSIKLHLS